MLLLRYQQVVRLPLHDIAAEVEACVREAYMMAAYQHHHMLPLHCAFMRRDELWLVLPYMEVSCRPSACITEHIRICLLVQPVIDVFRHENADTSNHAHRVAAWLTSSRQQVAWAYQRC